MLNNFIMMERAKNHGRGWIVPGSEQPLPELTQYRIVSILVASGIWRKINRFHPVGIQTSTPNSSCLLSQTTISCRTLQDLSRSLVVVPLHQWYSLLSIHHAACFDFKGFSPRPLIFETSPCCFWLQWPAAEICTQGTLSVGPRKLCRALSYLKF